MGVDDNLADNLETFFNLDYPLFEILFCIQDLNDPAILIVRQLIEKYPNVDAKLFTGGKIIGINPKINNIAQCYDEIKYELLFISDAGMRVSHDTLLDMISLLTERVGLVHQMPFTTDRPGFAGSLEKVYFGTCHARMYLFINFLGINCVTGMSCLMRKVVIDKEGGLKTFSNYIAEDYFLAKAFHDNSWQIKLAHQPGLQNVATYSVPTWQKRMIRWCKLRLKLTIMSWLEPFQECFMLGLCTSWTVNFLFEWNSLVFFLVHVLCWFLSDYILLKICQNGSLPFSKFEYMLSWLYRESICFYLFCKAAANPTVKWRQGKYRLKWGGFAEEIVDQKSQNVVAPITPGTPPAAIGVSLANAPIINLSRKPSSESLSTSINSANENEPMIKTNKTNFLSVKTPNNDKANKAANKSAHKRTNSYSVTINSNVASSNHLANKTNNDMPNSRNAFNNQYISYSDVEGSVPGPTVTKNSSGQNSELVSSSNHLNVFNHQNYNTNGKKTTNQSAYRSHHQHHHSISNPISTNDSFYKEYLNNYQSNLNKNINNVHINGTSNNFYTKDKNNSKLSDLKII